MALVTTGEAATGSTAAEGADMLSSLATLSMRPALSRPTELPGGQPPGSADGRFVRQANLHLSDAEGLSQLVATARDVPLSEWEDPTTLKPALEAAHTRLCSMVRATSQTINALEAAMATAQSGDATSCEKLLSALEGAEALSQRIHPRQEDKAALERLYRSAHTRLEDELLAASGRAAVSKAADLDALRRVLQLGQRAQKLRLGAPRLSEGLGAAAGRLQLLEVEGRQHARMRERCAALGVPSPDEWPPITPEAVVGLLEQGAAAATRQRVEERSQLQQRLRRAEGTLEAAERQHRDECGAGRQRIAALQKALEEQQVQRSQERAQAAAQQRVLAAQLQELRAAEAELRAQVGHLRKEVEKRDRWLDRLAQPGR